MKYKNLFTKSIRSSARKYKRAFAIAAIAIAAAAFAQKANAQTFGGGAGTQNDPWIISTDQHLTDMAAWVNNNPGQARHWALGSHVVWRGDRIGHAIGERYFRGSLDGKGYYIQITSMNTPNQVETAIFGVTRDATIRNLTVVCTENMRGGERSGLLIGTALGNLTIENVRISTWSGNYRSSGKIWGGMIGRIYFDGYGNRATISKSSVIIQEVQLASTDNHDAGGLIGAIMTANNNCSGTVDITDCMVDVRYSTLSHPTVGGIIGWAAPGNVSINMTRVVSASSEPSGTWNGASRGSVVGALESTLTTNGVFARSTPYIGSNNGTWRNSEHTSTVTEWDRNTNVYDLLERRNNSNGTINTNNRGNEVWGYDSWRNPQVATEAYSNWSPTGYVVRVTRGSNLSISNHNYASGTTSLC